MKRSLEPLKILVADDDPIFASIARSCLARTSADIVFARDGAEAFEALDRRPFDLALVDLSMPKVDGFRLIALIRATPRLRELPIIVMSSRNDLDAVQEAYELGANAFQNKPINWSLFPTHMLHIVARARETSALKSEVQALRLERAAASGPPAASR